MTDTKRPLRNGRKCCALNGEGKKCSRPATHLYNYHGDGEIYGYGTNRPTWVRIALCEEHRCDS
jgi:hypothetical protein